MTEFRTSLTRRTLLASTAATAATAALGAVPSFAQPATWPDRVVRIVVPYPAGGSTDVLARILAEELKKKLGQSWVIENRPGAGGNIGIDAVAKAEPDGYTIGAATVGNFAINQYLYAKMPYDGDRDLVPASLTWEFPNVAVVSSQHVPAKRCRSSSPGRRRSQNGITFGSPGVGTTPHLSGALFTSRNGIKATHVPFRGAAQTIPTMLSGRRHARHR